MNNNLHITEEELELIDQYLTGQLTPAERNSFEQQLKTNEEWKQKLEQVSLIALGIGEAELRQKMDEFHEYTVRSKKEAAPGRKMGRMRKLAVAAAIVVAVSALSWLLFFKPSAEEKLYAVYYRPDPGLTTEMGISDNYVFDRAMVDYKTGHYKEAISSWSKLLPAGSSNDTLNYFIASAHMANNDLPSAISYFDKIMSNRQSAFINDAAWYKGLALLKQGKTPEAIALIEKSEHPGKQALLLKLKN